MKLNDVLCDECEKVLFSTEETKAGTIGAIAQNKGFIYKNPFLFTKVNTPLIFCSEQCRISYYDKNVPKNPEMSAKIAEIKRDIPRMAEETSKSISKFIKVMDSIKKKR